jgi:glycosyltransferase involved in cell wall biosynthesis
MYWILPALLKGYAIIRKHNIGYIYATSPPHSCDIVGALLARLTGAKFIVDLRDPWASGNKRYDLSAALAFDAFLERFVFNAAHKVLTTTEEYAAVLVDCHKWMPWKCITIYNGFDSDDFAGLVRIRNNGKFVCSYLGNLYLQRSPHALLSAIRSLIDEKPEVSEKLLVRFIGTQKYLNGISLQSMIDEKGLQGNVVLDKPVTYRQSLQNMIDSDVLILFAPNQPLQIPAKIFEYMAAQRPILALTEEGATATLVVRNNAGIVVPQDDPELIKKALLRMYEMHLSGDRFYRNANISLFNRKRQTGLLAEVLESLNVGDKGA